MKSPYGFLTLAAAAFVATLAFGQPANAQTAPDVQDLGVENHFPDGMLFSMSAESDSEITEIRLRYEVLPDGTLANGVPDFDPATSVSTRFELGGPTDPLYFPPGTTIRYHWDVTDADGDEAQTGEATFIYEDPRFDWTEITGNGVTIHYYSGSPKDAGEMLDVAADQLSEMTQLLGGLIDFPVHVWIYDSSNDMRPALQRRSPTYEQNITTAGVRVASDTVLVLGNVSFDTLRHELTHVVTAVAGESAFGTLPAWLDEGTAVYGQSDPGDFESAIQRAIDRGNVFSVRSISSYPGDPDKVALFYGQSWSLVSYLIDTYGSEQFAQLFAEVKGGKRIGPALEATYGFDEDGLEDEWRAANDLPARATPEPEPPTSQPPRTDNDTTVVPNNDGGGSGGSVILILVLVVALAILVGGAGLWLARRFR